MRLNHDCIRDILLYIESNTSDKICCIDTHKLVVDLSDKYDEDTIFYHIRKIHQAGLVDKVSYGDGNPLLITCLSWNGHAYVDNIRDNKIWSEVKEKSKSLSSVALPIIVECAVQEVKNYFHLP